MIDAKFIEAKRRAAKYAILFLTKYRANDQGQW